LRLGGATEHDGDSTNPFGAPSEPDETDDEDSSEEEEEDYEEMRALKLALSNSD
jgi:hypothetical protein